MNKGYKVLLTYGPDEPWWFFDDWHKLIQQEWYFQTQKEAISKYFMEFKKISQRYDYVLEHPPYQAAFWNKHEVYYCEPCADYVQYYQGLLLLSLKDN